ncbi:unnamed protein product [Mesocestoides corti]|uniref:Secreted protein n=1 Tax=Mesocestoides corti TaxID=53468 RepID=A0A0R3UMD2_MESCO|nr:unnamed protein product [Mesocestoides corti]
MFGANHRDSFLMLKSAFLPSLALPDSTRWSAVLRVDSRVPPASTLPALPRVRWSLLSNGENAQLKLAICILSTEL